MKMRTMLRMLLVAVLLCLPGFARAEALYEIVDQHSIAFPAMDDWLGHFQNADSWIIVTRDNLDEHLERVLARGDSEEAVHARFAQDTLIFEAYSDELPADACFRFERIENDFSREVWHLRHWSTEEQHRLIERLESGTIIAQYDVYSMACCFEADQAWIDGWFTNYPPAGHEGGKFRLHFRNGVMYMMTYNVYGRKSGMLDCIGNWRKAQPTLEKSQFRSELEARPVRISLDTLVPVHVATGSSVTFTGIVEEQGTLNVTMNGTVCKPTVGFNNRFTVTVPITASGEHEVCFTLDHPKYRQNTKSVRFTSDGAKSPLILTARPDTYAIAGQQALEGVTDAGTVLTMQLDDQPPEIIPVDGEGRFKHSFPVQDSKVHTLHLTACSPDKEATAYQKAFVCNFESANLAFNAFTDQPSQTSIAYMITEPEKHIGEQIIGYATIEKIMFTEQGLELRCVENYPVHKIVQWGMWPHHVDYDPDVYVYLTFPSYAQDSLNEGMLIRYCGAFAGLQEITNAQLEPVKALKIAVEYKEFD